MFDREQHYVFVSYFKAFVRGSCDFSLHCVLDAIWGGRVCELFRCRSVEECTTWPRRRGAVYQSNSFASAYLNTVRSTASYSGMGSHHQLNSADCSYEWMIVTNPIDSDYAIIQPSSEVHYNSWEYYFDQVAYHVKASHFAT